MPIDINLYKPVTRSIKNFKTLKFDDGSKKIDDVNEKIEE